MTAQEIYNKVKKHLLKQKARSVRMEAEVEDEFCMYRGPNGLKCAVGVLIPNSKYKKSMENKCASDLVNNHGCDFLLPSDMPETFEWEGDQRLNFLNALQKVHDNEDIFDWDYHLADVALTYGLEP